jgi:Cdc6-like AAA superfamily ATPase
MLREAHRPAAEQSSLPRFHATASDHVSARSGDRFAAMRAKLRHAFTPSQPVADRRMFAGRDDVLKTVIRAIEDQRLHVVLYGERGIGKTSLLHMLTQAAGEARYIVVYSSCGANSTFEETFSAAAADIPLLFHSGFAPTTTEAEKGSSLADLLPAGVLTPKKFGDLCAKLTGTRVLIILDEFDRCESGVFRRDVAELIKNLSDRLGRVQLVLAGVAADLTELVEHIPSIRRNIFALRVPKMTDGEVLQIVANGEREAGFSFEPPARDFVVEIARGSPYIANLLCHHAGHSALDQGRGVINATDVWSAVDRTVLEFQSRIGKPALAHVRRLFEQGQGEALALAARASLSGDDAFSVADLQAASGLDERKAAHLVTFLSSEGLLAGAEEEASGARYTFAEEGLPMLLWMTWAQKNMRPTAKAHAATAS